MVCDGCYSSCPPHCGQVTAKSQNVQASPSISTRQWEFVPSGRCQTGLKPSAAVASSSILSLHALSHGCQPSPCIQFVGIPLREMLGRRGRPRPFVLRAYLSLKTRSIQRLQSFQGEAGRDHSVPAFVNSKRPKQSRAYTTTRPNAHRAITSVQKLDVLVWANQGKLGPWALPSGLFRGK